MTPLPGRRVAVRCGELPAAGSRHATSTPRISCVRSCKQVVSRAGSTIDHHRPGVRAGLPHGRPSSSRAFPLLDWKPIFVLSQGGGVGSLSLASGSSVSHPNTMSRICASTGRPAGRTRGVRRARVRRAVDPRWSLPGMSPRTACGARRSAWRDARRSRCRPPDKSGFLTGRALEHSKLTWRTPTAT
jgi:hypothetical protein